MNFWKEFHQMAKHHEKITLAIIASGIYQNCLNETLNNGQYDVEKAAEKTAKISMELFLKVESSIDNLYDED